MEIETDSMMHVFGSMILIDAGADPGFSDRGEGGGQMSVYII